MELMEHFEICGYAAQLWPRNFLRRLVRLVQSRKFRVWYDDVSHWDSSQILQSTNRARIGCQYLTIVQATRRPFLEWGRLDICLVRRSRWRIRGCNIPLLATQGLCVSL